MKVFCLILPLICAAMAMPDETSGFFIKIPKNVPRIGRRGDFENFFLKQSKSVPRIGRRAEIQDSLKNYSKVRPLDLSHIVDILSDDIFFGSDLKFIAWEDLDKALEEDPELLGKLTSLARDKENQQLRKLLLHEKEDTEVLKFVPLSETGKFNNKAYFYRNQRSEMDDGKE